MFSIALKGMALIGTAFITAIARGHFPEHAGWILIGGIVFGCAVLFVKAK